MVMQVVVVSFGCVPSEGIWNMTGCGGGAFSPVFWRILRSSESPTRSQHPTCPSGIGTRVVAGTSFAEVGGWIEVSGVLLECCGAFTQAGDTLGCGVVASKPTRKPRRIIAAVNAMGKRKQQSNSDF
jgi:hypothetical protein